MSYQLPGGLEQEELPVVVAQDQPDVVVLVAREGPLQLAQCGLPPSF